MKKIQIKRGIEDMWVIIWRTGYLTFCGTFEEARRQVSLWTRPK